MNNMIYPPYLSYYNRANPYFPRRFSNYSSRYVKPDYPQYKNAFQSCQESSPSFEEEKEEPFFEIFGISLFYDDILLICLIFFLYTEGVKDTYLFLVLILLLLS